MAKDLFSEQSGDYASYRPTYPPVLVESFLPFVKERKLAWDCATGNGQAAVLLAEYFENVEATDISEEQLKNAFPNQKVHYTLVNAENTNFKEKSFDLITVAQAYHWLKFDDFHKEVIRVAKPGAVIAIWAYGLIRCADKEINKMLKNFYNDTTGPYWDPERKYVDERYETIPFPYEPLINTNFEINYEWNIEQLSGYLNSWSSVRNFIRKENSNPVELFRIALNEVWRERATKNFTFPIFLKAGKVG